MHHDIYLFVHHIDCYFYIYIFFMLTCSLPLVFFFFFFLFFLLCLCPYPSTMPRKTRAHRTSFSAFAPSVGTLFRSEKCLELYETLNLKRKIWAKCNVLLDELDPTIRKNFEHQGWLPLLDIDYPPPATMIREFYLNLSIHVYDFNTLVKSWIRGVDFTITP